MAASQTFQDVRKELEDQWKYHSNNLFPIYTTVTKAALDKTKEKDQVTKYMNWESSDNSKANAIQDYLVEKWNLKIDMYVKNT